MAEPFVLGVNYWPRCKAMDWWHDFDSGEAREEFALIRELGLKAVRLFLLWDDFQPTPQRVAPRALARLTEICDLAAELGLKLDVTFFTGHMSGANWAPRWLLDERSPRESMPVVSAGDLVNMGYRNPYTDPVAVEAQRLLITTVVAALRDHPAIWLWNLGNEPDVFAQPSDGESGPRWARLLIETIRELDGRHPVTCGLHLGNLVRDNGLRIDRILGIADLATTHPYPMYTDWSDGPLDPDLAPFSCAMTASLSGRPVLIEEFGVCTAAPGRPSQVLSWTVAGTERRQFTASEEDAAKYVATVLPGLVEIGAIGALIWCFADYDPVLWDRPPCRDQHHERFFGLVRSDGTLKPHALALRDFAATAPMVQPIPPRARLTIDADEFYRDPMAQLPDLYRRFRDEAH
jgi:endo-1,4-beta-mannosidase